MQTRQFLSRHFQRSFQLLRPNFIIIIFFSSFPLLRSGQITSVFAILITIKLSLHKTFSFLKASSSMKGKHFLILSKTGIKTRVLSIFIQTFFQRVSSIFILFLLRYFFNNFHYDLLLRVNFNWSESSSPKHFQSLISATRNFVFLEKSIPKRKSSSFSRFVTVKIRAERYNSDIMKKFSLST
jgi:hypothetical protein